MTAEPGRTRVRPKESLAFGRGCSSRRRGPPLSASDRLYKQTDRSLKAHAVPEESAYSSLSELVLFV
jgi:hypothetical protein